MNSLFRCKLCTEKEPLLLSGETCYKTFLANYILEKNAETVPLNRESSIEQLLGNSSFFTLKEAKKFYLLQIIKLLKINNINDIKKKFNEWIESEQKNENAEKSKEELKLLKSILFQSSMLD